MKSDSVAGACDCCLQAQQNKKGEWHCASRSKFFPAASWDGPDKFHPTSCPSFKPNPTCYSDDGWIW